jgi:hypothetical protein
MVHTVEPVMMIAIEVMARAVPSLAVMKELESHLRH